MMRSNDPLENQLSRIPLRAPPAEWRESILAAAEAAMPKKRARFVWPEWIHFVLNPRPASWAGLAAVWALVFIFNAQTPTGKRAEAVAKSEPISIILEERQRELATVFDRSEAKVPPPPRKRSPGPQGRAPTYFICV